MVATFKEAIDVVIYLYKDNWNGGKTDNYNPIVIDIAETAPENGKRLNLD